MKIGPDEVYLIDGDALKKIQNIADVLNNPNVKVDWDKRRDLASLIDLILSRATPWGGPGS